MHAEWLIPDWRAPKGVRAVFTTRAGGHSTAPYDSLNLGDHVGDDATSVQFNRDELQRQMGVSAVFLKQVHGRDVVCLDSLTANGAIADAAFTTQRGLACTIMVADCLPVLLCDAQGQCVAALHAGWRGLAGGVVQATVQAMLPHAQGPLMAWLGPCIGPAAFEVGEDVREAFAQTGWVPPAALGECFVPCGPTGDAARQGKYLADLPRLARLALAHCGVAQVLGNDGTSPWCTVSQPSRFFSHRRDAAARGGDIHSSGRMAACIWLD
jgi:YfiH family protein